MVITTVTSADNCTDPWQRQRREERKKRCWVKNITLGELTYLTDKLLKLLTGVFKSTAGHDYTVNRRKTSHPFHFANSVKIRPIFGAGRWTALLLTAVLSVRLSVCLSHSSATHKCFKILKRFLHHTRERCLQFIESKFRGNEFRGSPRTSVLKRGTPP